MLLLAAAVDLAQDIRGVYGAHVRACVVPLTDLEMRDVAAIGAAQWPAEDVALLDRCGYVDVTERADAAVDVGRVGGLVVDFGAPSALRSFAGVQSAVAVAYGADRARLGGDDVDARVPSAAAGRVELLRDAAREDGSVDERP